MTTAILSFGISCLVLGLALGVLLAMCLSRARAGDIFAIIMILVIQASSTWTAFFSVLQAHEQECQPVIVTPAVRYVA